MGQYVPLEKIPKAMLAARCDLAIGKVVVY
jgi:hypothetical protein